MLCLVLAVVYSSTVFGKQMVPDPKRQRQIQLALVAHGYTPGKTWSDTVKVLKQIARDHHWQSTHAPDARVLILLGLGSRYSDPEVLKEPPSISEPGLRMATRDK